MQKKIGNERPKEDDGMQEKERRDNKKKDDKKEGKEEDKQARREPIRPRLSERLRNTKY